MGLDHVIEWKPGSWSSSRTRTGYNSDDQVRY